MDSFSASKTTGNFSNLFDVKTSVVDITIDGWLRANTGLVLLEGSNTILRRDYRSLKKVRLLSGCMSGLEPMCSGFVGPGMLTAAVIGDKCMAPPYPNIVAALRELNSVYGTLIVVMDHPSLRMNFSLAVEVAQREGIIVKVIFISDDCSSHIDRTSNRKGLAGTVLIYKIAGALADKNRSVDEIYKICAEICCGGLSTIVSNFISDKHNLAKSFDNIIFSLEDIYDSENVSTTNVKKLFQLKTDLPEGSVEGSVCFNHHKFVNVDEFTKLLLGYVIDSLFSENSVVIEPDKSVVVLFNNYGSIVNYEMYALAHEVTKEIENRGIKIARVYIGSVVANGSFSLSISIMKITDEMTELLDHPTEVSSWPANYLSRSLVVGSTLPRSIKGQHMYTNNEVKLVGPILPDKQADKMFRMVENVVMALISCEEQINKMGANCSMSLYGTYVKSGAEAINRALYENRLQINCPYALFQHLSTLTSYHFPDVSSSCYAVFFDGASQVFLKYFHQSVVTPQLWVEALEGGISALELFTKMKKGDRTMLDALYPALDAMKKFPQDYSEVAEAAELGSLNTVDSSTKKHQLPELGSHVVAIWMRAAVEGLKTMDDQYTISEEFDESSEDIFVV